MFGIGETELLIIVLFGFMVFGPDKLPGAGRTIGRALRQFRTAQEGFTKVVQTEIVDPATEMMNLDANKPNRDRAAELEEDADIEGDDTEGAAPRKETFAERKARLAAERAAAKKAEEEAAALAAAEAEAAAQAEAEAAAEPAAETPAEDGAEASAEAAPAPEPAAKPKPKTNMPKKVQPTAAADLYAKPVKRKAKKAEAEVEAEQAAPAEETPATAEPAVEAEKEDEVSAE